MAFLYTGQGSQYVNMLQPLRAIEPIVAETFAEADRIMTPLLGKPLTDFIFVDAKDATAVAQAEEDLRQTAITQPAVLATDMAMTRLLAAYGIQPDMTMGHSLGEYGALVASGALPFADALEAVSARGREMTRVSFADNGRMAAVFAPLEEIERILKTVNGYVVIANINSDHQGVIGGASKAVEQAMELLQKAGYEVAPLTVSHAFHTSIVAPASEPLRQVLARLRLQSPRLPIVANVNGEFYPDRCGCGAEDARHSRAAGRFPGAVRQGPAHAVRRRRARVRGSRAEEGAAGICRGCARRPRRCGFALHQSSEGRRHRVVQPGAVRTVCGGLGTRPRRTSGGSPAACDRAPAEQHAEALPVVAARRHRPRPRR